MQLGIRTQSTANYAQSNLLVVPYYNLTVTSHTNFTLRVWKDESHRELLQPQNLLSSASSATPKTTFVGIWGLMQYSCGLFACTCLVFIIKADGTDTLQSTPLVCSRIIASVTLLIPHFIESWLGSQDERLKRGKISTAVSIPLEIVQHANYSANTFQSSFWRKHLGKSIALW